MNGTLRTLIHTWPHCDYWDTDETTEHFSYSEVMETLEEAIGNLSTPADKRPLEDQIREAYPESITVYGWNRTVLSKEQISKMARVAVDAALSYLREDLEIGNPDDDGEPVGLLPELFEAAIAKDLETRFIWNCEQTTKIVIPTDMLVELVKSEWPEWFQEKV